MKKLLFLLLFPLALSAQTVTVTADVKSILAGAQATKVKLCASLVDATGQAVSDARVVNVGVIVPQQSCVTPDGSGHISTTFYSNDFITAGGATSTTQYQISWIYNGSPVAGANYVFLASDVTENLNTKAPANITPLVTPTLSDAVYARLDGGNSFTALTEIFNGNISATGTVTGSNIPASISGTGSCTNQFVTALNSAASPTCTTDVLAGPLHANQGTTTTLLHGNAAGNPNFAGVSLTADTTANQGTTTTLLHGNAAGQPSFAGVSLVNDTSANQGTVNQLLHGNAAGQPSFSAVVSADLNITPTTCTNQFLTAVSATGAGTCTADTLASAQHSNQGTTTTVLHGNAAGNPSFGAISLTADVSGILPTANGGTGQNSSATFPTSGTILNDSNTVTVTGKRNTPRIVTMADATSITPTSDTADQNIFASTQVGGTLTVNAPSGTPTDGQKLILRLKSTNSQTYSFNATYAFSNTTTAPTTLSAGKTDYIGLIWNATNTKWDVAAVDQGH